MVNREPSNLKGSEACGWWYLCKKNTWFLKLYTHDSSSMKQSECQQLICEILRATPEAASADAAVQTARLASKVPSKEKRHAFN